MSAPVHHPATPHLQTIPGGFTPGCIAHVTGTFTPGAASLIVKLQSGPSGDPTDEIGLCVYGRVREGQLGRNCFTRSAGWGNEELTHSVPGLSPSATFDLTILCDPQQFKIAYNGKHLCEFSHRTNPASLTYLQVGSLPGDLTLSCVWVEAPAAAQHAASAPAMAYGAPPPPYTPNNPLPYDPNPQMGYAPPPGMAHTQQYPQQYSQQHYQGGHQPKGLIGKLTNAATDVAGALGAGHLVGKATQFLNKSPGGGHGSGAYPQQGGAYPQQGGAYPQQGGAYPQQGAYPYSQHGSYPPPGGGHHSGGGGLLKKAAILAPAAIAIAGPGKALKYGAPLAAAAYLTKGKKCGGGGGTNKLLKYGAPLAAGYVVSKGVRKGLGGFGGGWSGSDSD
ncbi:5'-3' exoribonuclease 3 isoform X2 [Hyalella azteca]|uniref:Galectin n=1 Tax=Hyalella azteca TaxID=294128 RepID=A0A979FKQ6_HYAAZ|nr:5'-3' exoribonuclease 3 isoform X2 [Hyalella azteca]